MARRACFRKPVLTLLLGVSSASMSSMLTYGLGVYAGLMDLTGAETSLLSG